jgi:hypothetical protein
MAKEGAPKRGIQIPEITWESRWPQKFWFEGNEWTVIGFIHAQGSNTITINVELRDDEDKVLGRFSVDRLLPAETAQSLRENKNLRLK